MNLVVNFLSMLVSDESNGSVKRMLSVCSEFERIANVVLDKAERESHSRRKRKTPSEQKEAASSEAAATNSNPNPNPNPHTAPMQSKTDNHQTSSSSTVNPAATQPQSQSFPRVFTSEGQNFNPTVSEDVSVSSGDTPVMPEFNHDFAENMAANGLGQSGFTTGASFPGNYGPSMDIPSFQQPFVPQDLWQMPMTLEWDWADMTGVVFPDFGPGDGHPGQQHNGL